MSKYQLDPLHESYAPMEYPFSKEIWAKKYSNNGKDKTPAATINRVAQEIAQVREEHDAFTEVMSKGLFIPAGRIVAGAGTGNRVTLVNCFVNMTVPDSMEGIMEALKRTALTMQQGGGMGTDFSTLRPAKARLIRTNSEASGPLPFMEMWDSMCLTIMSAGSRRGAMMGTLLCSHPDLLAFMEAKTKTGHLTNFNLSILITNAFMKAVAEDADWPLQFNVPPFNDNRSMDLIQHDFVQPNGVHLFTYSVHKARDIWDRIMKLTYDFAEPGVIFIDRINELNNLNYCETIAATNPCGEQPLPPEGACNLGAVNLARMIKKPFQRDAYIDWHMLKAVVNDGIRFLDNVIDITNYPLEAQRLEQQNKRRIGLGIMGLADALIQLGVGYGSPAGLKVADSIMQVIANQAYYTSAMLAKERGCFPLFDKKAMLEAPMIRKLDRKVQDMIAATGLRNGILLTIAPTGTTAAAFGNYSSGLEPNFRFEYLRYVRVDGSTAYEKHQVESFIKRFARHCGVGAQDQSPDIWQTADDLTPEQHVNMQAAIQHWVDASISKTINVPKDISFEEFKGIYQMAWDRGCKGCTTYRPSDVRGAILVEMPKPEASNAPEMVTTTAAVSPVEAGLVSKKDITPLPRSEILFGQTVKLKWPGFSSAIYMTLNTTADGKPFEVFFNSKDSSHLDWMTALSLTLTALLRHQINPEFILTEYKQISAAGGSRWVDGVRFDSLLALIGFKLEQMIMGSSSVGMDLTDEELAKGDVSSAGPKCPECGVGHIIQQSGCGICDHCGFSKC